MDQESTKPGPVRSKGSWRDRLGINEELPKISEEFKQTPPKAASSERPTTAPDQPAPTRLGTPVAKPAPMAPRQPGGDLGNRIRQQREAAERMAEKRVAEAKDRAVQQPRPGPPAGAGAPPPSGQRPKFTFADEEFRQAQQEPREPPPPRQWTPAPPPVNSVRPVFTADRPSNAGDPRARPAIPPRTPPAAGPGTYSRPQHPAVPRGKPPNYPATTYPPQAPRQDGHWQARAPRSAQPGAYDPYRREMPPPHEGPYMEEDLYGRHPAPPQEGPRPRSPDFRGAHSRELAHVQEGDDLFEDEQNYAPQPRRRAGPQEYKQAYREFEGVEEEPEKHRQAAPFILIGALLLAVGVIAGALIYFYQRTGGNPSQAEVPVLAEPDQPVKIEPETDSAADEPLVVPSQQSTAGVPAAQTPAQKKQIYDRILGETTLEEQEQIAPSEEQPVAPDAPVQGFDADPLPLPLPPPPGGGSEDQGLLEAPGAAQSTVAGTKSAPSASSQQAYPVSASVESEPETSSAEPLPVPGALPPDQPTESAGRAGADAERQAVPAEPKVADAAAAQPAPATTREVDAAVGDAAGAGPIQIAQIPASDGIQAGAAPAFNTVDTVSSISTINTVPQALPDVTTDSTVKRRTMGRAGDRVIVTAKRNYNKPKSVQTATIAPAPLTMQAITQQPVQVPSEEPVEPPPAVESAAQPVQQQAVLAAPPAVQPTPAAQQPRAALSGYVIQLASHKTEADAQADYHRLSQQHGAELSRLNYNIQKTQLNTGATFYQLHLGSFATRQTAKDMCTALLAAGERDCLVKTR